MTAGHALVEACHRFIGTADLDLEERGLVAIASVIGALDLALLRIVPGAWTSKDIFPLDALVHSSREDGLGDVVLEGAGAALEAVGSCACEGDGEDVCAMGADWSGGWVSLEQAHGFWEVILTE